MQKILIIEDEEVIGELYKKKLDAEGYQVEIAKTIEKAQELITYLVPDLILVDYQLHGKEESGLNFIPEIRKSLPESKIVMLSNYSLAKLGEDARTAGANDFLIKLNTPPRFMVEYVKNLFG